MLRVAIPLALVACAWAATTPDTAPQTVPASEFDCDGKDKDHWYASSTDCSVYYRCAEEDQNAFVYECGGESVFYEPIQTCDWTFNVPPPCGTSPSTPSYETVSGGTITPEPNPFYCYGRPNGFYADPDCCTKYYNCDGNAEDGQAAIPQYCPGDLAFNEDVGYCDFAANVPGCETLQCTD